MVVLAAIVLNNYASFGQCQRLMHSSRYAEPEPACNGLSKLLMSGVFEDGHEPNGKPSPRQGCNRGRTPSFTINAMSQGDVIFPTLKALQTTQCPFKNLSEKRASRWGESLTAEKMHECRWVKPKLVCQVAFVEWMEAGHLRHRTFVALRDDNKAAEVIRET